MKEETHSHLNDARRSLQAAIQEEGEGRLVDTLIQMDEALSGLQRLHHPLDPEEALDDAP
jgi:hypothetical protein